MNGTSFYCPNCKKYVPSHIQSKRITLVVKDLPVTIESQTRLCDECENELFDRELEKAIESKAFELYREQKHLLKPEEIKQIRTAYGLSQMAFAKLLGFGDKTIARYENGSLQDEAPNSLIFLMKKPANMIEMLKEYGQERLSKDEVRVAMSKAKSLIYIEISVYEALLDDGIECQGEYSVQPSIPIDSGARWRDAS